MRPLLALLLLAGCLFACRNAELPDPTSGSADEAKTTLLTYLQEQQGKTVLAGQMDLTWAPSIDMVARVRAVTGKEPALLGYDFLNFTNRGARTADADGQTSEALAWWKRGGLVTFCWHWRDPSGATDRFYKNDVRIPLKAGEFDPTTPLGAVMRADLDFIAEELRKLRNGGVPVLWRPLHEAGGSGAFDGSGAWFWWGQSGAAAYKALYRYMHHRFTEVHGLDNLIWVWNGQGQAWFPGADVVDVAGQDVYEKSHHSQRSWYDTLRSWSGNKPVALTEVGAIPDPDLMTTEGALFSWFLVWNDNPTVSLAQAANNFWSGSGSAVEDSINYPWNTPSFERRVYRHPRVITLDELNL